MPRIRVRQSVLNGYTGIRGKGTRSNHVDQCAQDCHSLYPTFFLMELCVVRMINKYVCNEPFMMFLFKAIFENVKNNVTCLSFGALDMAFIAEFEYANRYRYIKRYNIDQIALLYIQKYNPSAIRASINTVPIINKSYK